MRQVHKAFILGAGLGTRLRPLTDVLPKPLVPYLHEPLIFQALRHCKSAGIDSFAINTHHLAGRWESFFPNRTFEGCATQLFHEPSLLETGGGIKNIAPWIENDPILVYNGDVLTDLDLNALIQTHQQSSNIATLALFEKGSQRNVAIKDNRIIDIRNALGVHPGSYQFTGIYIIEPEILNFIPDHQKISIIPAFIELIKQNKLGAHIATADQWQDLGTREEYLSAHLSKLTGSTSSIHPTAKIHPDASIERCYIGANCRIEKGAHLRNSIVWQDATIAENTHLEYCIVRQYAESIHHNKDL